MNAGDVINWTLAIGAGVAYWLAWFWWERWHPHTMMRSPSLFTRLTLMRRAEITVDNAAVDADGCWYIIDGLNQQRDTFFVTKQRGDRLTVWRFRRGGPEEIAKLTYSEHGPREPYKRQEPR